MANTIFGLLSLLFVITLITLTTRCNRNNIKTETTNNANTLTDTLNKTIDTLSGSLIDEKKADSLNLNTLEDTTKSALIDSIKNEELSLKENNELEGVDMEAGKKEAETEDTLAVSKNKKAADFKENINKPKTKNSGGLKATKNIDEVLSDNKSTGKTIIIGSGGGVTGAVTTYKLFEDGSLFENSSLNTALAQKKMSSIKGIKEIQNQFDALNIDSIKLNEPGNMYFFVGYEKDGKTHRCTWGLNDVMVPQNLKTFYENLMSTISENQ